MGNLRTLHSGLAAYLNDYEQWPQTPKLPSQGSKKASEDWWIQQLASYQVAEKTWMCPTATRIELYEEPQSRNRIHYIPALFDANPMTPRRWATQPWVSEVGDMHGGGSLIIFCDGSIHSSDEFLAQ